ncbi:MAG TPA: ribosome silencing factor [Gammaproteobacteria bacterium]|nr:ribosome silencing factor [Gammaproteobacteria bacterium]
MTETHQERLKKLTALVVEALEDLKALDIRVINVEGKSSVTDVMIIATGKSTTHVKAIADSVIIKAKHAGHQPLGTEGEKSLEWMLVDLNDVVVHVMLQEIRDFYNLEKLWETPAENGDSAAV